MLTYTLVRTKNTHLFVSRAYAFVLTRKRKKIYSFGFECDDIFVHVHIHLTSVSDALYSHTLTPIPNYLLIYFNRHAKCLGIRWLVGKKTNSHTKLLFLIHDHFVAQQKLEKEIMWWKKESEQEWKWGKSQNHNQINALSAVQLQSGHWCGFVKRITLHRIYFKGIFVSTILMPQRNHSVPNKNERAFFIQTHSREMSGKKIANECVSGWINRFFFSAKAHVTVAIQRPNTKRANFTRPNIVLLLIAVDDVAAWLVSVSFSLWVSTCSPLLLLLHQQ